MTADHNSRLPRPGIGLCLSGGGFRATLFHLGVLWRLNQFGWLKKIDHYSSVSGGSIIAGWLGYVWHELDFDEEGVAQNFESKVVAPMRAFTNLNLDVGLIAKGLLSPFHSPGELLIQTYRKHLFGNATLQDLPDEPPRFVINASNAQSGALWRFSKPFMADYRVGVVENPTTELAVAVAASSAFPPLLSPIHLRLNPKDFVPESGADLQCEPFTSDVVLMDGGVYDNLGLESVFKAYDTILISDAGGKMMPDPVPQLFWGLQAYRVMSMMDNQVRSLRKRDMIERYKLRHRFEEAGDSGNNELLRMVSRKGAYWGTYVNIKDYHLDDALDAPYQQTLALAQTGTRLTAFLKERQDQLVNWGYAICDAGMRQFVDKDLPSNPQYPYPGGVGEPSDNGDLYTC